MSFVNNWELLARYFTKAYFVSLKVSLFLAQLTRCLARNLFVSVLFLAANRISDSRLYMMKNAVRAMGLLKRLTRYFTNMTCPSSKRLITSDKHFENNECDEKEIFYSIKKSVHLSGEFETARHCILVSGILSEVTRLPSSSKRGNSNNPSSLCRESHLRLEFLNKLGRIFFKIWALRKDSAIPNIPLTLKRKKKWFLPNISFEQMLMPT